MPRKINQTKPGKVKSGKLSEKEIGTIKSMAHSHTAEQISSHLKRSVNQVRLELSRIKGVAPEAGLSLKEQLETRPEWFRFQRQFSYDEQQEFKHQYVQIMSQLTTSGEIYATEELQIFQVITLKIQIDRTLESQRRALDDINNAQIELDRLRNAQLQGDANGNADPQVTMDMVYWGGVYEAGKRTNQQCATEYKIYSDKQDKMLVALKSTRDQRIKVWENSDKSILGLVKLLVKEEQRQVLGQEAEMMKLASQKEKRRLARPHTYDDGTIDQPILTPETVFYEYEEEAQPSG